MLSNFRVTYEDIIRGELPCPGPATERESCDAGPCPAWTPWTPWSQCSQTCGGGSRSRIRECRKGRDYGECEGDDEETETCNAEACPSWTEWTPWTQCTQSCGGGTRKKVNLIWIPGIDKIAQTTKTSAVITQVLRKI